MYDKVKEKFGTNPPIITTTHSKTSGIVAILTIITFGLILIGVMFASVLIWNKRLEAVNKLLELAKCSPEMFRGNPTF